MSDQTKSKDSFIIYRSFIDAISSLPDAERLQIFDAISHYALDGKITELTGISYAVFTLIRPQLDANRKRFENGCKDKKKSKSKAKNKQKISKPEANDNVNDNVNDNENLNQNSEFENFWQSYKPIHTGKGNKEKSKQLFLKAIKKHSPDSLMQGLSRYMEHCHTKNSYTKSVEIWLKNEGWSDEYSDSKPKDNSNLIDEVNKIAKENLVKQIEINGSKALIYVFSDKHHEKLTGLDENLRNQIKQKVHLALGTTGVEVKF